MESHWPTPRRTLRESRRHPTRGIRAARPNDACRMFPHFRLRLSKKPCPRPGSTRRRAPRRFITPQPSNRPVLRGGGILRRHRGESRRPRSLRDGSLQFPANFALLCRERARSAPHRAGQSTSPQHRTHTEISRQVSATHDLSAYQNQNKMRERPSALIRPENSATLAAPRRPEA